MTAHALRYDINLFILFTELPLLERPAAAAEAGFTAVEFWWPFDAAVPDGSDVDRFVAAVEDGGVQLVGLNFFAGDMAGGDRGLVSWPARSEFRDNIEVALALGARLASRAFNALYGNRVDDASPEQQDELASENLALAAKAAAEHGAVVLLEPASGAPRYPLRTAADVVEVMDRVEQRSGVTNLRLLFDLYHLTVNGDDMPAAIAAYTSRVGHVQIADAPGRHEPGTGDIDIDGSWRRWPTPGTPAGSGWSTSPAGPAPTASIGCPVRGAAAPDRTTDLEEIRMATVAFIGLGIMGAPMAGHLVDAGFDVVGYNRSPGKVAALVERGRARTASPRRCATRTSWR